MIPRRKFIAGLGAAAAWPLAARGQQGKMPLIGYLSSRGAADPYMLAAVRQGLKDAGFIEGRNVSIEYRFAENQNERLPELAADLVRRQVAVIIAAPTLPALAAKSATSTVPIVFEIGGDPVALGLVASLNRPGGNATGVTNLANDIVAKQLELLRELLPAMSDAAVLLGPGAQNNHLAKDMEEAARARGLKLHVLDASVATDFGSVFAGLAQSRVGGLVVDPNPLLTARNEELAALALRYALPSISAREFAQAGGLMGYGGDVPEAYRLAGFYAGRILKGERPADLPVQQSTKVQLVLNLKTAKALGITVPITLLGRADEVIE
jgi:putative ABC transport system substrate-binding protein